MPPSKFRPCLRYRSWWSLLQKLGAVVAVDLDVIVSEVTAPGLGLAVALIEADNDGNVIMTEGLVLQDRKIWEAFMGKEVTYGHHDAELYFEENDLDAFQEKLDQSSFEIEYVSRLMTHSWGQRVIRIYDPDYHVIEIGESMEYVNSRK